MVSKEQQPRPGFSTAGNFTEGDIADGVWGLDAQGVNFNVIGNVNYSLNWWC